MTCITWEPYSAAHSRSIGNERGDLVLARTNDTYGTIFGHFNKYTNLGYFAWDNAYFTTAAADMLTVHAACVTVWMPYVALEEIPDGAVEEGVLADGTVVYIARMEEQGVKLFGYYPYGSDVGLYECEGYAKSTASMYLLVAMY